MIRRVLPVFLVLCILPAAGLWAKSYTVEKVVALPQEFYVGDLVELRVEVSAAAEVVISPPEKLPDSYWLKVENAETESLGDRTLIRIYLRPYAPGIRTLPEMRFGDIVLRDIKIQTRSILASSDSQFAPPAGQMLLPGTNYYIALFAGIVFVLPVLALIFWGKIRRKIRGMLLSRQRRKPYVRVLKVLRDLEASSGSMRGNDFYTLLVGELRLYLTFRGSIDYASATAREFGKFIMRDFPDTEDICFLSELMKFADEVKFGGRKVIVSDRDLHVATARRVIEDIEAGFMEKSVKDVDL